MLVGHYLEQNTVVVLMRYATEKNLIGSFDWPMQCALTVITCFNSGLVTNMGSRWQGLLMGFILQW